MTAANHWVYITKVDETPFANQVKTILTWNGESVSISQLQDSIPFSS